MEIFIEPEFWKEVEKRYEDLMRLQKLYNSYVHKIDTFLSNYITRYQIWNYPAAVEAIMECLPKQIFYPQITAVLKEKSYREIIEMDTAVIQQEYLLDKELKNQLKKINPVLRQRRENVVIASENMWEYILQYIEKKGWRRNEKAIKQIINGLPECYARFRAVDLLQLARKYNYKQNRLNPKEEPLR